MKYFIEYFIEYLINICCLVHHQARQILIRYEDIDDWKPSKSNDAVLVVRWVGGGRISMNCISLTGYNRLQLIARKRDNQPARLRRRCLRVPPEPNLAMTTSCCLGVGSGEEGETGGTTPLSDRPAQCSGGRGKVRLHLVTNINLQWSSVRWPTSTSTTRRPRTMSTSTTTAGVGRQGLSHTGVAGPCLLELLNCFDKTYLSYQLLILLSSSFSLWHYTYIMISWPGLLVTTLSVLSSTTSCLGISTSTLHTICSISVLSKWLD